MKRDAPSSDASIRPLKFTVYSTTTCGYCRSAEALLQRLALPYEIIDVTRDWATREALVDRAHGRRTVPVIFHGDEVIGGYAELARMAASGELRRRFAPPPPEPQD